jgi:hypothetical protein
VIRFQSNPSKEHWQAVKRILSYKLCFGLSDVDLIGYSDKHFVGDVDDRKSISRYIFLFDEMTISCLVRKRVVLQTLKWKMSILCVA